MTKKLLIITYYWPPASGAGVQRWLKFVKYLPQFGFDPLVITVDPDFAAFPATDETLMSEVPDNLHVIRTKATNWFRLYRKDKAKIPSAGFATGNNNGIAGKIARFIRGNFFIPDPRRGWNRFVLREAGKLIESGEISNVITTSPPHSTQLIGLALKKKYPDIRWIADLRDPWTEIYYYSSFYHTAAARMLDIFYEREVLEAADHIITVGRSLKNSLSVKISNPESKIMVIPNGYDPADFEGIPYVQPKVFTISYIGTLSSSYPVIDFAEAIRRLSEKGYVIKVKFVGIVSDEQRALLNHASGNCEIEFIPYMDHKSAIRMMMSSSMLLLIIPDHFSNKSIITGKLFEYLASGKPVLCLGPQDGDAAEILVSSGHGKSAEYRDIEAISTIIEDCYNSLYPTVLEAPIEFSRINLTLMLTELL